MKTSHRGEKTLHMNSTSNFQMLLVLMTTTMLVTLVAALTNNPQNTTILNVAGHDRNGGGDVAVWFVVETATLVTMIAGLAAFCRIHLRKNATQSRSLYKHI
jgi:heme/copper-type cytochrome/quinol oxidase subunit 2